MSSIVHYLDKGANMLGVIRRVINEIQIRRGRVSDIAQYHAWPAAPGYARGHQGNAHVVAQRPAWCHVFQGICSNN